MYSIPGVKTESDLRANLRAVVQEYGIAASVDYVIDDWRDAGLLDHIEQV